MAAKAIKFDGATRPPSHPDSWTRFKQPYEYQWQKSLELCQSTAPTTGDGPGTRHLRNLKEYHDTVMSTLGPRAIERIRQVLGPDRFRDAGGAVLIQTADLIFVTPEASESFERLRSQLVLTNESNLATFVMDTWAACECILRVRFSGPAIPSCPTPLEQSFVSTDSFDAAPDDLAGVEVGFFPRLWLAVHDQAVDQAVADDVFIAKEWRRHLYDKVPNLDSPLHVFISAAKEFDRKRSHGAGDRERVLARVTNPSPLSKLSPRKGNGDYGRGRSDYGRGAYRSRGGRGRGRMQQFGYDRSPTHQQQQVRAYQQQQQTRFQPHQDRAYQQQQQQQQQFQQPRSINMTAAGPAEVAPALSVHDRLGTMPAKRPKAESAQPYTVLHTVRNTLSQNNIDAYHQLPLNAPVSV